MKVILNADVENLGEEGDICDVKDGYGRNYLLPKQLALPYNKSTLALFEQKRDAIEKRKEEKRKAALSLKERIEEEPLVIRRPAGETGKLFGSVTAATLVEELEKKGIQIQRKRIEMHQQNIKMVGNYSARIKLYDEESATLKYSVESTSSEGGSEPQKQGAEKEKAEKTAAEPTEAPGAAESMGTTEMPGDRVPEENRDAEEAVPEPEIEEPAETPETGADQAVEEEAAADRAVEEAADVVEKTVTEPADAEPEETAAAEPAAESAEPEPAPEEPAPATVEDQAAEEPEQQESEPEEDKPE